jgi:hypothetical protein
MLQSNHTISIPGTLSIALLIGIVGTINPGFSQSLPAAQHTERSAPPTRDPKSPGFVTAKELPDGTLPPATADGNFIIGPGHSALEMTARNGVLKGTLMSSR